MIRGAILDILFVSSKGSQYQYYKALSKVVSFSSVVVTLFPGWGIKLLDTGLSLEIIKQGIDFHLKRKHRKYKGGGAPSVLRGGYAGFSAIYFSLIYLKFRYYLKQNTPKVICLWNGHRLPEMAVRLAARGLGIKIAYFENGLLPNTTTMDFSGVNAFSSLPRNKEFYLEYAQCKGGSSLAATGLVVRHDHKRRKPVEHDDLKSNLKYIFVPFQVNFDSQVIINSPRVNSMEAFYDILLNVIESIEDKEIMFVIKEHPSDARAYCELHNKHPRIIFTNNNTEDLIRNAWAIITLNSSVGIEAAMLEKRVIVLGDACYSVDGMTLNVAPENKLVEAINSLEAWEPDLDITRSFFSYLTKEYCLPGAWQGQLEEVELHHLAKFESKLKAKFTEG